MRFFLLFFIAIAFLSIQSLHSEVVLGAKIGYSASKLSTDIDEIKERFRNGFLVGAFGRFGEDLHIQPEITLVEKGGLLEGKDFKLTTVDLVALIGYNLYKSDNIKLRANIGPMASLIADKDGGVINKISETISKSDFADIMWGMQFGTGIDFLFMTLDIRYEMEFNDLYDTSGVNDYYFRNQRFSVNLGIKLFGN